MTNTTQDTTELERVQEPIRKILLKADPFGEIDQTGTFNELMEFVTTYTQSVTEEAVRVERAKTIKNIIAITIEKDENELFVLRYREKVFEALTPPTK